MQNWGVGLGGGHPLIAHKGGKSGGKDNGTNGSGGKDNRGEDNGNNDTGGQEEKPIVDSSSKPGKKDADPEGDDPDEILSPAAIRAAMFAQGSPQGVADQNGTGLPKRTTKGKRGLQPWAAPSLVGPHVPRPDENAGSTTAAVQSRFLNGANAFPTPDDEGGPTDPRASAGTLLSSRVNRGTAASPVDGGQGPPPPSDPR